MSPPAAIASSYLTSSTPGTAPQAPKAKIDAKTDAKIDARITLAPKHN
jgi:hypothetical protein